MYEKGGGKINVVYVIVKVYFSKVVKCDFGPVEMEAGTPFYIIALIIQTIKSNRIWATIVVLRCLPRKAAFLKLSSLHQCFRINSVRVTLALVQDALLPLIPRTLHGPQ